MAGVIDQFEADKHFFNGFEWGTCVQRIAKPDEELFTLGCCGPYPKDLLKNPLNPYSSMPFLGPSPSVHLRKIHRTETYTNLCNASL